MDESKLPKWARDQMAALRREVDKLREDRDAILGQGDPSKCQGFWFEGYYGDDSAFPAPLASRRLVFRGSTGDIQLTAEQSGRNHGETWLKLNSIEGDGMIVKPHVSNVITVRAFRTKDVS